MTNERSSDREQQPDIFHEGEEGPGGSTAHHAAREPSVEMPEPTSTRYPDHLMPFVGSQSERDEQFADVLEAFLVNYGYNTSRAYRADLDDVYGWARKRGLSFFELTEAQIRQYQALLRRRKYSEGTVRRHGTAWRALKRAGN